MSAKLTSALGESSRTLFLVDISSFIFRAFFAIRLLHNRRGEPTNAIYGVATMLARLADEANPEFLAVVYDSKEPSFRKEMYVEYKAHRSAPPEELTPQFDRIEELVRCMGIRSYRQSGVEADDLIATLALKWIRQDPSHRAVVVTGDKDLMQLVGPQIRVWDTMAGKVYGREQVEEKFGVPPEQIRDYLGLVGDSSDNIPGIKGVGPKTAVELLKIYGSVEGILQAAEAGKISGKRCETIKTHAEDARLSLRLASLETELPAEPNLDELRYRFKLSEECAAFLKDLDFHSLVEKWAAVTGAEGAASTPTMPTTPSAPAEIAPPGAAVPSVSLVADSSCFRTVNTEEEFQKLLEGISRSGEFGFDVETTSLNPRQAELVGIAIAYDRGFGCYIPVGHRLGTQLPLARVLEGLRPYLEDPRYKKIGQNLKYDWSVMKQLGFKPDGIGADTMVAAYVLDPEGRHNLESLARQYLNYDVMTYEQVCGKGKDQLCFDLIDIETATRYSAEDAWVALKLWDVLKARLQEEHLMPIFASVDLPLVNTLSKMESEGVCIDEPWLRDLSREFEQNLRAIEERIGAFTHGPINLNSTKQLAKLLFEDLALPTQTKTKTGYSTDASVLEALAPLHEVPRMLLEYREISKLKGTYVDPLPQMRDPVTRKIHASFHQTVTATGRLSSSDPNLQNIPVRTERGRKIRRAFVPSEGNVLISADYSQIELRILAHMSDDAELKASFLSRNEDVHQRTASEIFGIPLDEVTDRQRGIAKAINFGLMYGKTAFGLSQELKIPRREAQDVIDRYFQRYKGVKAFLDGQIANAKETGSVMTVLGRKRVLRDINSRNPAVRNNAERMAMNTPIQGTAADLMKLAMIELDHALARGGYRAKLIIQVHDEVVLDCPKDEVEAVQKLVCEVMEGAMKLSVPLKVNASAGKNWMEL